MKKIALILSSLLLFPGTARAAEDCAAMQKQFEEVNKAEASGADLLIALCFVLDQIKAGVNE